MKKLMITLQDIEMHKMCRSRIDQEYADFTDFLKKQYHQDQEINVFQMLDDFERSWEDHDKANATRCLITFCPKCQTPEMIDFFKSIKTKYATINLIKKCKYAQTPEMIKLYKSFNPDVNSINHFIIGCEYAQTDEMIDFYISKSPSLSFIEFLRNRCEFAKKNRRLIAYKDRLESAMKPVMQKKEIIEKLDEFASLDEYDVDNKYTEIPIEYEVKGNIISVLWQCRHEGATSRIYDLTNPEENRRIADKIGAVMNDLI